MNFCADGETLLTKDLDLYVKALVEEGHYAEVVTNLTCRAPLEKFLSWDKALLEHLTFKCSFHYLELKKKNKLDLFADNVHRIWESGASANIEITPSDELIPFIEEVKEYSFRNFGALPHLTIARDDRTKGIDYLTDLSPEEYDRVWKQFDSSFWRYKKSIFGKRQTGFCYAGSWGYYIDLTTGDATQCYCGKHLGDLFAHPESPLPDQAIGQCPIAHCYNGHALLTLGLIPHECNTHYGDIRDREKLDGGHWLRPELKAFLNSQLEEQNKEYDSLQKRRVHLYAVTEMTLSIPRRVAGRIYRSLRKG